MSAVVGVLVNQPANLQQKPVENIGQKKLNHCHVIGLKRGKRGLVEGGVG